MSKLKKSEAFTREREREIEQVSSLFVICLYAQCYIHTLLFELKKNQSWAQLYFILSAFYLKVVESVNELAQIMKDLSVLVIDQV